ncbi:MaoC/PaaZ C-terminal domain-containing protein [Yersinia frederiksenii]|uniref:MaoC/PaaZ C-terminal domain-containing protein n=1 Tax=Yersinia frederiksenii TaxID=29484 RepID=UPI0025AA6592|nr:MaoC/PaaZ C-terminal domain-containing protein [Yersinia frederiksenii]MDN0119531.1 MaoC/PaaZ C-terminal domain-containing protein [Yersinia frederiksenii]
MTFNSSFNYHYSLSDAERWAEFSGDYNPIHFDLQHAQHLGQEQLTVHGMRAMLDIKYQLSTALLTALPDTDFLRFNARLRQPVLCHTPYQLQLSQTQGQVSGNLLDSANGESCFNGKLRSAPALRQTDCEPWISLPADDVYQLSQQFPGDTSHPAECWAFFDALLFKLLVAAPQTLATAKEVLPGIQAETLIDVFKHVPVIQTHHDVHFSADLLRINQPNLFVRSALHYAIEPTLVVGNPEDGWVLRSAIAARTDIGPLITTAVTLKTWPLAAH